MDKVKDLMLKLRREATALDRASERYAEAVAAHRNRQVQIARLRVHVKQNIVHYMQAVWAFESPDQRILRLREMPAPTFVDGQAGTRFRFTGRTGPTRFDGVRDGAVLESLAHEVDVDPDLDVVFNQQTLSDVADLHTLLGFHGNYLVFPLTGPNPLTDFMTAPYVDSGWKLVDPDEPAALNRMEFARYVCHLHETLSEAEFDAVRPELEDRYAEMLTSPSRAGEEIIVPTGSLFIEMLPSGHTLLEDFKLAHRAADVRKVHADIRAAELDNVRYAARVVTGDLADPDVDSFQKVDIQGGAQPVIDVGGG